MNIICKKNARFLGCVLPMATLLLAYPVVTPAFAQTGEQPAPSLVITNDPLPADLKERLYSKPARTRDIKTTDIVSRGYYEPTETPVTKKVQELNDELYRIQRTVSDLSTNLSALQRENEQRAAEYYTSIATVSTQLQSGTTPGNPRLIRRISEAEQILEALTVSVAELNQLAANTAQAASDASFLLESTRVAYSISGAVEEDHVRLAQLEDNINNTVVIIERVLNNVNDDITRASTYLSSERSNIRTLSLAVANGDLYGKSLSNRPFSSAAVYASTDATAGAPAPAVMQSALSGPRPLVKIRFDRPDINYEQPVYMAVNEALQRYPNAQFDLVAINPTRGNAAEVAIESTRARRNAERVLRTLTQMGLPLDRIDLSYKENPEAATNEVHLYIR